MRRSVDLQGVWVKGLIATGARQCVVLEGDEHQSVSYPAPVGR